MIILCACKEHETITFEIVEAPTAASASSTCLPTDPGFAARPSATFLKSPIPKQETYSTCTFHCRSFVHWKVQVECTGSPRKTSVGEAGYWLHLLGGLSLGRRRPERQFNSQPRSQCSLLQPDHQGINSLNFLIITKRRKPTNIYKVISLALKTSILR